MLRDDGYRVWDGEVCVFEYKYSEHPRAAEIVPELLAASSKLVAEVAARNRAQLELQQTTDVLVAAREKRKELESKLDTAESTCAAWKLQLEQTVAFADGEYKKRIEAESRLQAYEKWFADNAAMLATHHIGGYRFAKDGSGTFHFDDEGRLVVDSVGVVERLVLNPRRQKPHAYHSHLHLLKARIGSGQCIEVGSVQWVLFLARMHREPKRRQLWRQTKLVRRLHVRDYW